MSSSEVTRLNFKVGEPLKKKWNNEVPESKRSKLLRAFMHLYLSGKIKKVTDDFIQENKNTLNKLVI